MSLPKRDGIHGRYYLIHKPDTAPEVLRAVRAKPERLATTPFNTGRLPYGIKIELS